MVAAIVVFVIAGIVALKQFRVVPAHHVDVVERLGQYRGTLGAGMHFLVPVLDRVAKRFALGDQVLSVSTSVISRDNQTAEVSGTVRYQIVDPERAHYSVPDIQQTIVQLMSTAIRDEAGRRSHAELREEGRAFRAAAVRVADETAGQFGAKILDCDLTVR